MKKAQLITAILLVFNVLTQAQIKFSGIIKGLDGQFITVEKPVRGNYFPAPPEQVEVKNNGKFEVVVAGNEPGFMKINIGNTSLRVFLEPGNDAMTIDLTTGANSLEFTGPHAAQNRFLAALKRQNNGHFAVSKPSSAKDFYVAVTDQLDAELSTIRKVGRKEFSKAFCAVMEDDIHYYYASLFSAVAQREWQLKMAGKNADIDKKWGEYWQKIIEKKDPIKNPAIQSEWYLTFLDYYIGGYRLGYLQENEFEGPDTTIGEQFLEYDRLLWKYFQGDLLQYNAAALYSQQILMKGNLTTLADLLVKYKNDFPKSPWLPYLKLSENAASTTATTPVGTSPEITHNGIIELGKDKEINSIKDLIKLFKGKVVYLDLWATWCAPCMFEFRQAEGLEKFAKGKDIALLFVSVDDEDRHDKWRKVIEDNHLEGYHVHANFNLRDELINTYGDGSTLALPRFIIFDKKGNLVVKNAKQPSHNSLLYKQLEEYLKN